jgi:DNA-binding LacI/PurR family transcriptional regulator
VEQRRVSMGDVARLAGVSTQTVSRVSNGFEGVLEPTRQQVLAAMKELGYRPNSAARALRAGRFRTLGVITFTLSTTGNVRTLEAIAGSAARRGYAITLIPVTMRDSDSVEGAFSRLAELAVDGAIVIMESHLLDDAEISLPPGIPVVVADSMADGRYPVVDTDQTAGARAAVEHLLGLGHTTVHHVAGPVGSYAAERRTAAWRAALAQAGAPVPDPLPGDWTATSGYDAGRRLVGEPGCTAVFVSNDQMALGVLRAAAEHGRRVPDDLSVVGFDDIEDAGNYTPPLTTVHQDFAEVGRRCVDLVLALIAGESPGPGPALVPARLVVRASTGPRRAG